MMPETPVVRAAYEDDDAMRDMAALMRAELAGDAEGLMAVAANLSSPAHTIILLTRVLGAHMRTRGFNREMLAAWQREQGL